MSEVFTVNYKFSVWFGNDKQTPTESSKNTKAESDDIKQSN